LSVILVPATGLEPVRHKARDFKSHMSTIPPRGQFFIILPHLVHDRNSRCSVARQTNFALLRGTTNRTYRIKRFARQASLKKGYDLLSLLPQKGLKHYLKSR
jgi:hypothetical protein